MTLPGHSGVKTRGTRSRSRSGCCWLLAADRVRLIFVSDHSAGRLVFFLEKNPGCGEICFGVFSDG